MQLGAYRAFRGSITGHCLSLGMMSSLISVAARCAPCEASWVWCFSENSPEWPAASGLVPALALGRRGTAWGGDSRGLAGRDPYHVRVRVRTGKGKNGYRQLPNTRTRTYPYLYMVRVPPAPCLRVLWLVCVRCCMYEQPNSRTLTAEQQNSSGLV